MEARNARLLIMRTYKGGLMIKGLMLKRSAIQRLILQRSMLQRPRLQRLMLKKSALQRSILQRSRLQRPRLQRLMLKRTALQRLRLQWIRMIQSSILPVNYRGWVDAPWRLSTPPSRARVGLCLALVTMFTMVSISLMIGIA